MNSSTMPMDNVTPRVPRVLFCHDYQNNDCNRLNCKYVHSTREEEYLYLTTGLIPRVLIDKWHKEMSSRPMNKMPTMTTPPPPPPPSPPLVSFTCQPPPIHQLPSTPQSPPTSRSPSAPQPLKAPRPPSSSLPSLTPQSALPPPSSQPHPSPRPPPTPQLYQTARPPPYPQPHPSTRPPPTPQSHPSSRPRPTSQLNQSASLPPSLQSHPSSWSPPAPQPRPHPRNPQPCRHAPPPPPPPPPLTSQPRESAPPSATLPRSPPPPPATTSMVSIRMTPRILACRPPPPPPPPLNPQPRQIAPPLATLPPTPPTPTTPMASIQMTPRILACPPPPPPLNPQPRQTVPPLATLPPTPLTPTTPIASIRMTPRIHACPPPPPPLNLQPRQTAPPLATLPPTPLTPTTPIASIRMSPRIHACPPPPPPLKPQPRLTAPATATLLPPPPPPTTTIASIRMTPRILACPLPPPPPPPPTTSIAPTRLIFARPAASTKSIVGSEQPPANVGANRSNLLDTERDALKRPSEAIHWAGPRKAKKLDGCEVDDSGNIPLQLRQENNDDFCKEMQQKSDLIHEYFHYKHQKAYKINLGHDHEIKSRGSPVIYNRTKEDLDRELIRDVFKLVDMDVSIKSQNQNRNFVNNLVESRKQDTLNADGSAVNRSPVAIGRCTRCSTNTRMQFESSIPPERPEPQNSLLANAIMMPVDLQLEDLRKLLSSHRADTRPEGLQQAQTEHGRNYGQVVTDEAFQRRAALLRYSAEVTRQVANEDRGAVASASTKNIIIRMINDLTILLSQNNE